MSIRARFKLVYSQMHDEDFALNVDLVLPSKGVTAIFGPSGSGKSSLLRCIAGLEKPDQAELIVDDDVWQNQAINKATHHRPIGYVFQESSLFPHLSVAGNLNYAVKRADKKVSDLSYQKIVEIMGLAPLLARNPDGLSGGERQRVAIARAILIQPQLLLMDEPLASLDAALKQDILPYLEHLRSQFDIPILYVSHSIDEVARLADQVVVLERGRVAAQGNISEVFSSLDMSHLLAEESGVILQGHITERDSQWHLSCIAFKDGEIWVADGGDAIGQSVRLRVLAKDVSLAITTQDQSSILNRLAATITDIEDDDNPAMSLVRMKIGDAFLLARITRRSVTSLELYVGLKLWAQIKSAAIVR